MHSIIQELGSLPVLFDDKEGVQSAIVELSLGHKSVLC